ncbi:MAG: DUF4097 family beta strand repeat-containing protein [Acidimicrobiales bacterium]
MIRRLLAVLIALVGTAGVVIVVLSLYFPEGDRSRYTPEGRVRSVEVDVESGRVEVVPAPADGVIVDRTRRYLLGTPVADESVVDGVLRLQADCPRIVVGCKVDYRLEVPSGVAVRIRTDSGSVSVEGINGMVEVDTEAGNVRLTRTQGPVRVNTSAGNIDAVDLAAEYLDATTGAGRIRLSLAQAPGRVGLQTGAGNVDLALPEVAGGYRVDAEAGAGNVDVGVPSDPGGSRTVIARSGAGNIAIRSR